MEHSKYYYEYKRNYESDDCDCKNSDKTPEYYKGSNGYTAIKVIEGFQPNNYNVATAITYLLRSGKKIYVNDSSEESRIKDIEKAIDHLCYEIKKKK